MNDLWNQRIVVNVYCLVPKDIHGNYVLRVCLGKKSTPSDNYPWTHILDRLWPTAWDTHPETHIRNRRIPDSHPTTLGHITEWHIPTRVHQPLDTYHRHAQTDPLCITYKKIFINTHTLMNINRDRLFVPTRPLCKIKYNTTTNKSACEQNTIYRKHCHTM